MPMPKNFVPQPMPMPMPKPAEKTKPNAPQPPPKKEDTSKLTLEEVMQRMQANGQKQLEKEQAKQRKMNPPAPFNPAQQAPDFSYG